MKLDADQRIAQDKDLLDFIRAADADLSVQQLELLRRSCRTLELDRPLAPELRAELVKIRELLPELVSED